MEQITLKNVYEAPPHNVWFSKKWEKQRERERENVLKRNVVMENRKREIKDGNDVGRYR